MKEVHIYDTHPSVIESISLILRDTSFNPIFHCEDSLIDAQALGGDTLCRIIPFIAMNQLNEMLDYYSSKKAELIVLFSKTKDIPAIVYAIKHGAFDFLEFPFDPIEVLSTLSAAEIQKQINISEEIERSSIASKLTRLTLRENIILENILIGKRNKIIAYDLEISQRTVENHRSNIMKKLDAKSIADLINIINKISAK